MMIYAGGPIDYGTGHARLPHELSDLLVHRRRVEVYCPQCQNEGQTDDLQIMAKNRQALMSAQRAVFLLDGTFTVGTPIEIEDRLARRDPSTMAIIHPGKAGLFVRVWATQGVAVFRTVMEAVGWLG